MNTPKPSVVFESLMNLPVEKLRALIKPIKKQYHAWSGDKTKQRAQIMLLAEKTVRLINEAPPESDVNPFLPQRLSDSSDFFRAVRYALHIFGSDAVFTFIPKNACSSMRYSIALNNGFIKGPKEVAWIHANNLTLVVKDMNVLLHPRYSFVILRCPYRRMASVFFDKFLLGSDLAKGFAGTYFPEKEYGKLTFQDFVYALADLEPEKDQFEMHWRPQSSFLIYKHYDRYFSMENLHQAPAILKREIGFDFRDSRDLIGHHTEDKRVAQMENAWCLSITQLREQASTGLPTANSMFNDGMKYKMHSIYGDDIQLYAEKFGSESLLFDS